MKQLRYEVGLWSASSSEVIAVYSYTILHSFTFSCHGTVLITGTTLLLWKRTNTSVQQNMHIWTRIKLTRVHCLSFSTAPVFFLISKIEYIYLNSSYILFYSNFISHLRYVCRNCKTVSKNTIELCYNIKKGTE